MRRSLGSFLTVGQVDAGDSDPAVAQFLGDAAQDDRIVVTARTVREHDHGERVAIGPMQCAGHTF